MQPASRSTCLLPGRLQSFRRLAAHLVAKDRGPAEQHAWGAQGHSRPAPKVEPIAVTANQPIFELEFGIYLVMDLSACLAECVVCVPMGKAARVIGAFY